MNFLIRSTLHGSLGFAAVSVAAYSIWAFAPRVAGSEIGMYALIALVYLGGAGLALCGLLKGENKLGRFYRMFLPAFFGYALIWSLAWFLIKDPPGMKLREWTGAAAGTLFFSWVCWIALKKPVGFWGAALVLFALHTLGYFVGGKWMYGVLGTGIEGWTKPQVAMVAKLGWGLFHGLGFGAGIGFMLGWWQRGTR
ncbi:hypothetical protein [Prosthecobacter sp.]|uniref:hypothetical protein n=1 Tax=Prosthecobacter sp. TaxID=1965333 RepID=UPI001DCDA641|nr:hypothetical protein [Prosthecobacter sp.]MCB1278511.1 hypothetical protein [Prosthecobacter sp.]